MALGSHKLCKTCGENKPRSEFRPQKGMKHGIYAYCRPCEKKNQAAWRKSNPSKVKLSARKNRLKRAFGISLADYEKMLDAQNGCCAICSTTIPDKSGFARTFSVDHCHTTGKIRGLLCSHCNTGLGLFKDDVSLMAKAIQYLSK